MTPPIHPCCGQENYPPTIFEVNFGIVIGDVEEASALLVDRLDLVEHVVDGARPITEIGVSGPGAEAAVAGAAAAGDETGGLAAKGPEQGIVPPGHQMARGPGQGAQVFLDRQLLGANDAVAVAEDHARQRGQIASRQHGRDHVDHRALDLAGHRHVDTLGQVAEQGDVWATGQHLQARHQLASVARDAGARLAVVGLGMQPQHLAAFEVAAKILAGVRLD